MNHQTNLKRRLAAVLTAGALLLSGCAGLAADAGTGAEPQPEAVQAEAAELDVLCFDAGKADAFLLTTPHGAVLIDAGEKGFGKEILSVLEEKGVEKLDYLIISHFDKDHVGGAAKVLNNFPVGTVLQSDCPKDSEAYEKYVKALRNAGLEPVTVRETYAFTLDGVSYSVDPPRKSNYRSDDSNNSSLIVSVVNGAHSFLFTGDAQTERIEEFLSWNTDPYDVLKVPHHGGEEPLLEALIENVRPAYAVITSSDEEPEAESTLAALSGAEVYLTRNGPVTFHSGGTALTAAQEGPAG